jgi:hypothetical protein
MHEAFHFLTHFEGKLLKTIKTIYLSPGKLSTDYSNGIRQRYYKPVSLYLMIVILYLLFPFASGMNMEMRYYKDTPLIGAYISSQIEHKSKIKNISESDLSEKFHEKSKSTSKILLLLLIPLATPLVYFLYFTRKRYIFDNIILLSEINIFFLLTIFMLIPILSYPLFFLLGTEMNDGYFGVMATIIFTLYSTVIFHKVFKEKWWISLSKGALFCMLYTIMIVAIYRTIVFQTTFALL